MRTTTEYHGAVGGPLAQGGSDLSHCGRSFALSGRRSVPARIAFPTALVHRPKGSTDFPMVSLTFPNATTAFRRGTATFRQSTVTCRATTKVSPAAPMSFLMTIVHFRTHIKTRNL